jgi:hypothetical protein
VAVEILINEENKKRVESGSRNPGNKESKNRVGSGSRNINQQRKQEKSWGW